MRYALELRVCVTLYKSIYSFTNTQAAIASSCITDGCQHYPVFRDSYARFPPLIVVVLAEGLGGRTLDPSRRAASASPCFDVALSLIQRPYRCHICPWTRRHSMITCSSHKSREDFKPSASLQCVHAHAHARCYIQHLPERPGRAIAAPVTRIRSTDKGR